jgi:hypothetical protein
MSGLPPTAVFFPFLDLSQYSGGIGRRPEAPNRRIGNLPVAEVTVSEDHDDDLTITEHPVEYGAAITDHAFKRPSEVRVRVGWSDAYIGDSRMVYEQILQLQAARQPFDVYTGKRAYQSMLVASVHTETNSGLEHTFLTNVTLRQIILVSTQTLAGGSANINNLALPQLNTPTTQTGQVSTLPASLTTDQIVAAGGTILA